MFGLILLDGRAADYAKDKAGRGDVTTQTDALLSHTRARTRTADAASLFGLNSDLNDKNKCVGSNLYVTGFTNMNEFGTLRTPAALSHSLDST